MQLTVTVPDKLPHKKLAAFVREIEQMFQREGIDCDIHQETTVAPPQGDAWEQLDIDQVAVDTGISDFAQQHDHYLYGTPKRT